MQTVPNKIEEISSFPNVLRKLNELVSSEYFKYLDLNGIEIIQGIINYAYANNWPEQKLMMILFEPVTPTKEELESYRNEHDRIYIEEALKIINEILMSEEQFFGFVSGMYAGKSTLTSKLVELLNEQGYRDITLVPIFMNENEVTLRGAKVETGDTVSKDGFKTKRALRYNPNWNESRLKIFFRRLGITTEQRLVIHFDEFSFMPPESVLVFKNFITVNYPNIKVLFAGLNRNAFGQELEGNTVIKDQVRYFEVCKSFVPGYHEGTPSGTHTLRYVILPNGMKFLDCGTLPVVVPKGTAAESKEIVQYTPAREGDHMYKILAEVNATNLREKMVNPNAESIKKRKEFLEIFVPPKEA